MNPQPLENKVAVVTGAARGIGYAIARRFAMEGAGVVLADIRDDLARQSAQRIEQDSGRRAIALQCDVADRAQVNEMVNKTVAEFGSLDIMVANASICPLLELFSTDNATFQRTIDVNLIGAFNSAQAAAEVMVRQGRGGRLIFITSLATVIPDRNQVDYAASKGGVKMMMSVFAQSLGHNGITSNAIAPGVIQTDISPYWDDPDHRAEFAKTNPVPRVGKPSDIAAAAVFLASDDAEYVTGTTIRVDGGRHPIG